MASRASRRDEVVEAVSNVKDQLYDIMTKLEALTVESAGSDEEYKKQLTALHEEAIAALSEIDTSEAETLAEELESWRDNMSGTNLESTSKYEEVSEAADYLRDSADNLGSLSDITDLNEETQPDDLAAEISTIVEELDEIISTLGDVEFPGAFGR